jgi:hypothetical protein
VTTPEFLLLAHVGDASAGAVADTLARRFGSERVAFLPPELLATCSWTHQVASDGTAHTVLRLSSGAVIDSASVRCVLNRMLATPILPQFARSRPKDRDYAEAEFHALLASWLAGFGSRLINPSGPWALIGGSCPFRAWMLDAMACGLPVLRDSRATAGRLLLAEEDLHLRTHLDHSLPGLADGLPAYRAYAMAGATPAGRVLIAGSFVGGSLAAAFGEACLRLAERSGCRLSAFRFSMIDGCLALSGVDTSPALEFASEIEAVAQLLADVAAQCWR